MAIDLAPVAKYFWDIDFSALTWEKYKSFIIRRILQEGDYHSVRWLQSQVGDDELRAWIESHNGGGLSPRQIRYWALMLDIDKDLADQWVKAYTQMPWGQRR